MASRKRVLKVFHIALRISCNFITRHIAPFQHTFNQLTYNKHGTTEKGCKNNVQALFATSSQELLPKLMGRSRSVLAI